MISCRSKVSYPVQEEQISKLRDMESGPCHAPTPSHLLIEEQNREYMQALIDDIAREERERLEREKEEEGAAAEAATNDSSPSPASPPLSPRSLRRIRLKFFEEREKARSGKRRRRVSEEVDVRNVLPRRLRSGRPR